MMRRIHDIYLHDLSAGAKKNITFLLSRLIQAWSNIRV